jgi:ATP-dependent RNA helicase DDX1
MAEFEYLGLAPELIAAVQDMGWLLPTPVQAEGEAQDYDPPPPPAPFARPRAHCCLMVCAIRAGGGRAHGGRRPAAVGLILGGGDVSAAAETGSGKTGAFALPLLQVCHEQLRGAAGTKAKAQPKQEPPTAAEQAAGAQDERLVTQAPALLWSQPPSPVRGLRPDLCTHSVRARAGVVLALHARAEEAGRR